MPSFYNGRRFFLTFPQCNKTQHELIAYLQSKAPVKYYIVARELHEDGNPHLHACVEFMTIQRHGIDWLDSFDKHPNKQDPRKWKACIQYVKKDGDYIDGPESDEPEQNLQDVLRSFSKEVDWYEYCVSKKISFQFAKYFWETTIPDSNTLTSEDVFQGYFNKYLNY